MLALAGCADDDKEPSNSPFEIPPEGMMPMAGNVGMGGAAGAGGEAGTGGAW